jgi:hypothetical protein
MDHVLIFIELCVIKVQPVRGYNTSTLKSSIKLSKAKQMIHFRDDTDDDECFIGT